MEREPQINDRVRLPTGAEGEVVATAQTVEGWYVGVRRDEGGPLWKGFTSEAVLLEGAGESGLIYGSPGRTAKTRRKR
jgi:hypothetical protein